MTNLEREAPVRVPNSSGLGRSAVLPPEIEGWNWGAFLLNWIWGLGHRRYIALWMFVPLVNLALPFVLGVKGNAWAWRKQRWDSVAHFQAVQRRWARWGIALWLVLLALLIGLFVLGKRLIRESEPYRLASAQLQAHLEVEMFFGEPISSGLPVGWWPLSGPRGRASFSFDVTGPKGQGRAHVEATQLQGHWRIDDMAVVESSSGRQIRLK